ncbi:MAG TPA: putative quinol monooxygenase [Pyrinomonadaceae bacterium]
MTNDTVTVLARVQAKKGMEDQVRRQCLAMVAPSRADEGCIDYEVYQSTDDPTVFVFFENWLSREDVDKHLETPHSLTFDRKTEEMLTAPEEIVFLKRIS